MEIPRDIVRIHKEMIAKWPQAAWSDDTAATDRLTFVRTDGYPVEIVRAPRTSDSKAAYLITASLIDNESSYSVVVRAQEAVNRMVAGAFSGWMNRLTREFKCEEGIIDISRSQLPEVLCTSLEGATLLNPDDARKYIESLNTTRLSCTQELGLDIVRQGGGVTVLNFDF